MLTRRQLLAILAQPKIGVNQLARIKFSALGTQPNNGERNAQVLSKAVESIANLGGGIIEIDGIYELSRCVPILPRVSLDLRKGGLVSRASKVDDYGFGQILLPGNFHPAFTQNFDYSRAKLDKQAASRLLINRSTMRFEVGDQIFIASEDSGRTQKFVIPQYGWLNRIIGVDSAGFILKYPLEKEAVNLSLKVARLSDQKCRAGLPAFFWEDGVIIGGSIETEAWHWMSDSAMLNCKIFGLKSVADSAIYGNTFQRSQIEGCDFYFRRSIGEMSHN